MIIIRVNTGTISFNRETKSKGAPIIIQEGNKADREVNNVHIIGDARLVSNEEKTKVWIECERIDVIN